MSRVQSVLSSIAAGLFGLAAAALVLAATIGTAQLLAAQPPCGRSELCLEQPFAMLVSGWSFGFAAAFATIAAFVSRESPDAACVLGCLAIATVIAMAVIFAWSGGGRPHVFDIPLWTMGGPALAGIGVLVSFVAGPGGQPRT